MNNILIMVSTYIGFFLSFLLGGTVVWLFLKTTFSRTRVPRSEYDLLNSSFRDSIVENVVLEGQISIIQERVEELSEKLLKAEQELSIANDAKASLKSMNEILQGKLDTQKTEVENFNQKFEEK